MTTLQLTDEEHDVLVDLLAGACDDWRKYAQVEDDPDDTGHNTELERMESILAKLQAAAQAQLAGESAAINNALDDDEIENELDRPRESNHD